MSHEGINISGSYFWLWPYPFLCPSSSPANKRLLHFIREAGSVRGICVFAVKRPECELYICQVLAMWSQQIQTSVSSSLNWMWQWVCPMELFWGTIMNSVMNSLEATVHYLCISYYLKVVRKIKKFWDAGDHRFVTWEDFGFIIRLRSNKNRFLSLALVPGERELPET